jgi:hypothetical protein
LDDNEILDGNIIEWIIVYYGKNLGSGEELITLGPRLIIS